MMRIAATGRPLKRTRRIRTLSGPQQKLLELLQDEPGLTLHELAEARIYNCTPNIERALSGLISKGLVSFTVIQRGIEQQVSYTLTYTAKKLLLSSSG